MQQVVPALAKLLVGVLPVLCFLASLIYLDSYKLVRLRAVLCAILAGAAAAGVSLLIDIALLQDLAIARPVFVRYVAPVLEEYLPGKDLSK